MDANHQAGGPGDFDHPDREGGSLIADDRLRSAQSRLEAVFQEFGDRAAILTSLQREGVVIIDLALQLRPDCQVFLIDTGRLPGATLDFCATVEGHFAIEVGRLRPDRLEIEAMVAARGLDLFRSSVPERMLCCELRKVRPLARLDMAAVITGVRREQGVSREHAEWIDRSALPVRVAPLVDWTRNEVLAYTTERRLPEHPLYSEGYRSIGCDPCTRPIKAGEQERDGRWWWETDAAKECGLIFTADGRARRQVDILLDEVLAGAGKAC